MSRPLYGLVLAGGESRRMGSDKALLVRDGRSQLSHAADLLATHTERVFVSARREQLDDPERGRYDTIADRYDNLGPVAGILSALEEHPGCDWLVVACDLPNIDDETLTQLVAERTGDKPFTAYRSSYDGMPEPLCAIYSAASVDVIRSFLDDGVVCPRKMLIRSDTQLLEQPNPAALDNINTRDDLAGSVLEARR